MKDLKASTNIREAGNTWNYALALLIQKGYALYCTDEADDEFSDFEAHKAGNTFSATNPLALLALVCIGEEFGPDWWQQPVLNSLRELGPRPSPVEEDGDPSV